jgi:hypothetical protein
MIRKQFLNFMLLGFAFACTACVSLPQRGQWTQAEPPLNGVDGDWAQADETILDGLRIKTLNNRSDLYIAISADKRALQSQLSGRYGQELRFWFGTLPQGHGISISFTARPADTEHEDPLADVDRSVTLEGPSAEGLPRPWVEGSEGLGIDARTSYGTLTYVLKLPLQAEASPGFALGTEPGKSLTITISASALEPAGGSSDADKHADDSAPVSPSAGMGGGHHGRHGHGGGGGGGSGGGSSRPSEAYGQQLKITLAKPPPGS